MAEIKTEKELEYTEKTEAEKEQVRTIEVMLSRDRTTFSWMTYFLDGGGLTHASIAFDEDPEYYYSFTFKGFKREYKASLQKRPREMKRYKLAVTEEQYQALKRIIEGMENEKSRYAYSKLDVSLCVLKLPNANPQEDRYFCSEFVAMALDESGSVKMSKEYSAYTPNDIAEELEKSGKIKEVIQDAELQSAPGKAINAAVSGLEKGKNIVLEFTQNNLEKTWEANPEMTPFLVSIGVGTISSFEIIYRSAAAAAGKIRTAMDGIPAGIAKQTGRLMGAVSNKTGSVMEKVVRRVAPKD